MNVQLLRCSCRLIEKNTVIPSRTLYHVVRNRKDLWEYEKTVKKKPTVESADQLQESPKEIVIPRRIKRDKLSILSALAATVSNEHGGPHNRHIDDPFLLPVKASEKRQYSLAKASGQKAASYVMNLHPEFFEHGIFKLDETEPLMKAFEPVQSLSEAEDEESGLVERIARRMVSEAHKSYHAILDAGKTVSPEVVDDLLDLLAFYNSEDIEEAIMPDEQFVLAEGEMAGGKQQVKWFTNTWKHQGLADRLFQDIKEPSARAYNTMLCCKAKYFQVDKAYALYQEMKEKKIPVTCVSYNSIIKITPFLENNTTSDERWNFMMKILRDMKSQGVKPDLDTFHSLLSVKSKDRRSLASQKQTMQIVNEMKLCGIEPSLAIWYYVVLISCSRNSVAEAAFMHEVIDYLKGHHFELEHLSDYEFFSAAMSKCHKMQDLELGYKVNRLLNTGNNIQLLGDSVKEGHYFTDLFLLLCKMEDIETVMKCYRTLAPYKYSPRIYVMQALLECIEMNEAFNYLPQIWTDITRLGYHRTVTGDVLQTFLECVAHKKQSEQLQDVFIGIVKSIKEWVELDENDSTRKFPFQLTSKMHGPLISICLNSEDFETAWDFFMMYKKDETKISQAPSLTSLKQLYTECIKQKDVKKSVAILEELAYVAHPELDNLVNTAKKSLDLSESQRNYIDDLLQS